MSARTRNRAVTALPALALLAACGGQPIDPMVELFEDLPADQVMIGVYHQTTSDGVVTAKLLSDTVYMFQDSAVLHLRGVDLELFDANGQKTAHLTSRQGRLNQNTNSMVAIGNVVLIVVADGQRIESEELHYDPPSRRIWSEVTTRRTVNGQIMTADGFSADDQFRNVQMTRPRGVVPGVRIDF
jgi:LPS export ABC transporter protein LptC